MRKLISTACAAALIGSAAIGPATASPLFVPQPSVQTDDSVIHVGNKGNWKKSGKYQHGKRNYRHGNNSNDWWIPGLILGGVIVGSALSQPRYRQPAGNSCGYWSQRCSANWSRPNDYRGCMRYYGC
jgi:hypothetical protein